MKNKTLTFAFMEPFESARGVTVFHIMADVVSRGFNVG